MTDCATRETMRFETHSALALEAAFDGGRLTSDGGLVWLAETDEELGLCEAISECVPEWRKRRGHHSLASLVRQRVFQIACGYEDQNDSDSLREDPLLSRWFAVLRPRADRIWPASLPSRDWRTLRTLAAVTA